MDETANPATPTPATPAPETNGHAPPPRWDDDWDDDGPVPTVPDGDKLQLSPEGWEFLADRKWVNQEYNLGRWEPYLGNYIAVYKKQLIDFGPDLLALRERVVREHNVPRGRAVITYIDPGPIT